jgi:quercetin dioxygenase-like cupin family protein
MIRFIATATVATALLGAPGLVFAQDAHSMSATRTASLEWAPIQPPGFDAGMEFAVVLGDPSAADQPYTLRLSFPDGYRFPAHYHPNAENVTVLSGTFLLGMGATVTDEVTAYEPGDYLHVPATKPHYGGARGATVIQLHGVGPFDILLADPAGGGAGR